MRMYQVIKVNKLKLVFFAIIFSICTINYLKAQGFHYKNIIGIPNFIENFDSTNEQNKIMVGKKFVYAEDYLPKGFVKSGKVDYTLYLQKALRNNKNIVMPNFPVLINDKGLDIQSGSTIIFNSASKLLLKPSNKQNYEILRLHNISNVVLFSPKIVGDRNSHLGKGGEWGMGISVKSSTDINILNPQISNCWGDGIYLGQSGNKTNKNIKINFGVLDNNRRNGISVISADGLSISNIILSNTNGTNPQAGLDFEPNFTHEVLENISVRNIYTFNNANQGIFYCFNKLNGGTGDISIDLSNHFDRYSSGAIGIMNNIKNSKRSATNNLTSLKGKLTFNNVDGSNNNVNFRVFDNSHLENFDIQLNTRNKSSFKSKGDLKRIKIIK